MNSLSCELKLLCQNGSTLLWLEGAHVEQVNKIKLIKQNLVLSLGCGTEKVVHFEKFSKTKVGIQFWNKGRVGVLYSWTQVPAEKQVAHNLSLKISAC